MLLLLITLLAACTPTCEQSCRKLLSCELDESPRTALEECQGACESQERLYESWEDDDPDNKVDRLHQQRQCIRAATCDEIAAGACFDPFLDAF